MADVYTEELIFGPWSVGMLQPDTAPGYRTLRGGAAPLSYAFVTSTNSGGSRITISTMDNNGNRVPVATRIAA